jgi:hypothetical protein
MVPVSRSRRNTAPETQIGAKSSKIAFIKEHRRVELRNSKGYFFQIGTYFDGTPTFDTGKKIIDISQAFLRC